MKVVIAGGGFGGVKTALELSNKQGIEVSLLTAKAEFEHHGSLYRSAFTTSPPEVVLRLEDIFSDAKNIKIVQDPIANIDPSKKTAITAKGQMFQYDSLVLALGSIVNYFNVEGMHQYAATTRTVPATIDLRGRIVQLCRSATASPSIVIVGAGATGVELAGDLQIFVDMIARKYGTARKRLKITLVESKPVVLPTFSSKISAKARQRLLSLGIDLKTNVKVVRCDASRVLLETGEIPSDLTIWAGGNKPVEFFAHFPAIFSFKNDLVQVDDHLRVPAAHDIYVIGDTACTPYSGMAQTALYDAKFLASNILYQKAGLPLAFYKPIPPLYVVPIGRNWAVMQQGKSARTGYTAWLQRHQADAKLFKDFEPYKKAVKTWRRGNFETNF